MDQEVIVGSRWKSLLGVAACAASVGVAAALIRWPPADLNPAIAWMILVMFGFVGTPVFALLTFKPQRLVLGPDGFEHVGILGVRSKVGWHEVAEFFVWRVEYSAHVAYRPWEGAVAIKSLGGGWQGGSERVVEILNRRRVAKG